MSEYLCPDNPAEGNAKEEVKLFMLKKKKKKKERMKRKRVSAGKAWVAGFRRSNLTQKISVEIEPLTAFCLTSSTRKG